MDKTLKNIAAGLLMAISACQFNYVAAEEASKSAVSANVPLESYIYTYLNKLDGMGYIKDMRIGMKPYTRLQVAKWVLEVEQSNKAKPAYINNMIGQLKEECAAEIRFLKGQGLDSEMGLKEWQLNTSYYDGDSIVNTASKSFYQPLVINNNGYKLENGFNAMTDISVEKSLDDKLVVSVTPRFDYSEEDNDVSFPSAYLKTKINNVEIAVGKDALWWGQGERGSLVLSNNAKPMTYLKLTNIEPMHFKWFKGLGDIYASAFYAEIADMKKFDGSILKNPGFIGTRMDFVPTNRFTFGITRTSIVEHLNLGDTMDFITGHNGEEQEIDKWNSIGGVDFRWRLPHSSNAQLYGEIHGEDQLIKFKCIPSPAKVGNIFGLYLPKLTKDGCLEANIEVGHTGKVWYNHWVFTDGYVNAGNIIGDPMGNNADRYYLRLTQFIDGKNQMSLHLERLNSDENNIPTRTIDSIWLSGKSRLNSDLLLEGFAGVSDISQQSISKRNYAAGLTLTKYY